MAGKRVRLDSKFQSEKSGIGSCGGNDGISQLADDILVDILSLLSQKEAARTSVLSSRWMNLWKHTSSLDFSEDSSAVEQYKSCCDDEERSSKFVEWVNGVVQSHKSDTLKEFRVCFGLGQLIYSKSITRWLEFALARHVQKLDLDLLPKNGHRHKHDEEILLPSTGGAPISKSLKEFSLKGVKVTCEAIETLLRICPLLEKLVIHVPMTISNLEVCGPSLALKHLELKFEAIESIKVSAPNLTTLIGVPVERVVLENAPMLVEVSVVDTYYDDSIAKSLPKFSWCISQLEILTLALCARKDREFVLSACPGLPKLKKLVISPYVVRNRGQSLTALIPWIMSCPNLEELILNVVVYESRNLPRRRRDAIEFRHHHLKVFKFYEYQSRLGDLELVSYILENSVVLEKLIIDPRNRLSPNVPLDLEPFWRETAKEELEALLPSNVELVIL